MFVADSPATPEELAEAIGVPIFEVEEALEKLGGRYFHSSAVQLVRIAGGYQLCTKPEFAELVTRFLKPQQQKLSRSLMEVLAIVAYKQPITSAEIEQIRGVNSDYGIRQLGDRRLVVEIGRKSTPGRPMLFGTTQQFLHTFNLESLDDLPVLDIQDHELRKAIGLDRPADQPSLPDIEGQEQDQTQSEVEKELDS